MQWRLGIACPMGLKMLMLECVLLTTHLHSAELHVCMMDAASSYLACMRIFWVALDLVSKSSSEAIAKMQEETVSHVPMHAPCCADPGDGECIKTSICIWSAADLNEYFEAQILAP